MPNMRQTVYILAKVTLKTCLEPIMLDVDQIETLDQTPVSATTIAARSRREFAREVPVLSFYETERSLKGHPCSSLL